MNSTAKLLILVISFCCLFFLIALLRFFHRYWWIPFRIQYTMSLQGIKGPPYEFIHGNNKASTDMRMEAYRKPMAALTHDIVPRVMPQIYSWINIYGEKIEYGFLEECF